jgi:hypothetical protein
MDVATVQGRTQFEQKLVELETDKALWRNGLALTSPLRDEILSRGRIIPGYDKPAFRVANDQGTHVTPDAFIHECRRDPRYSSDFPPERPRISRDDQKELAANFAAIAAGEVIVE